MPEPIAGVEYYAEQLEFRETPRGRRVLLPSDLDVTLKQIRIRELEDNLERIKQEPTPPEVEAALAQVDDPESPKTKQERLTATIRSWEDQRVAEQRAIFSALWARQRELQQLLQLMGVQEGEQPRPQEPIPGEPLLVVYGMREMLHEERLWADDQFGPIDPKTNERRMTTSDLERRNDWLLGKVLLWRAEFRGEQVAKVQRALDAGNLDEAKKTSIPYPRDSEHDRMNPGQLQEVIARTLTDRMWAYNSMDPQLEYFFRTGGAQPRHQHGARLELLHADGEAVRYVAAEPDAGRPDANERAVSLRVEEGQRVLPRQ